MKAGKLGKGYDLWLLEPLDELWIGSTARVFLGKFRGVTRAVKVLRPETLHMDLPKFGNEVKVVSRINDRSWVTRLHEFGFLRLTEGQYLPPEPEYTPGTLGRFRKPYTAMDLAGEIMRYSIDEIKVFLEAMQPRANSGWLPYLVFQHRDCLSTPSRRTPREQYLFQMFPDRTTWSMEKLQRILEILQAICHVYQDIHDTGIFYNDPKMAHYGWSNIDDSLFIIDWNF